MGILKVYKQFVKQNKRTLIIILIFGEVLSAAISLLLLPLFKEAIESSLQEMQDGFLLSILLKALIVLVLYLLSMYVMRIVSPKFIIRCNKHLRSKFIDYMIHLKYSDIEYYSTGDYLKAFDKLDLISGYSSNIMSCVVKSVLVLAINVYLIVYVHWILILILLGLFLILMLNQKILQPLKVQQNKIWEKEGNVLLLIDSEVQNLALIKSYMLGETLENRFRDHMDHIIHLEKRRILLSNFIQTMQQVTKIIILLATPLICWVLIQQNLVSLSTVMIASFSFSILSNSINEVMQKLMDINKIKSAVILIDRYLSREYMVDKYISYGIPQKKFSGIKVKDLKFQYNTRTIFENCNVILPDKGLVILIGESGSGKTTFLKLLAGQLYPAQGDILISHEYKLFSAIACMSLASQDSILFPGTVRDNIQIGNIDSGDKEVNEVVDLLGVRSSINELKDGLNTLINAEGTNLSGGQKQIVNLCRALCKDSSVILLDEPTSSQSPENERIIIERLKEISKKKLVIIVTHARHVIDSADIKYKVIDQNLEVFN